MDVRLKRVYEPAKRSDGDRILIDRLWPRWRRRSFVSTTEDDLPFVSDIWARVPGLSGQRIKELYENARP